MKSVLSFPHDSLAYQFHQLARSSNFYDEARDADGTLQPIWDKFLNALSGSSSLDMAGRQEMAQRLIHEQGATYKIYDDPAKKTDAWKFDILPHLIDVDEWTKLEAGLKQRSRLLNAIVDDLYGERRLLKEGDVPPSLLYANMGFLRAAHGVKAVGGHRLFHHAVDLGRGRDGNWMVLADRTQAPSGKGYALQNRIISTSLFPDEFGELNVERLSGFFQAERDSLRALAPQNSLDPIVVLLTPGPLNETYFEHAFKARYLGFPLVEGADITVRDSKVYLKTLEGLRQVDVIVRRVDDDYCDPLELRPDTWLGVAGLMEAWRAGNVAIVNGIGSGVVEASAFLPFLPRLCRRLLSEDLQIPNAITWWCGQSEVWDRVKQNMDDFVFKAAFPRLGIPPSFPSRLSAQKRSDLVDAIKFNPHYYTAQQKLNLSTSPVFVNGHVEQRSMVLRCYIVPNGEDYIVMPGGLTRVSPDMDNLVVSMQGGGISKDTWIMAKAPVEYQSLLPPQIHTIRSERSLGELPSRVADHFFWLGRYAERLESYVRILRAVFGRMAGERSEDDHRELRAMIPWLIALKVLPEKFPLDASLQNLRFELCDVMLKEGNEDSVPTLVSRVRYNAFVVRDRLSDDTWRLFNQLDRDASIRNKQAQVPTALQSLNALILDLAAFSGMEMENMTRGHGWRFLDMGRRVERAYQLMLMMKNVIDPGPRNDKLLGPLMEICDSSMTYRRRYHARPTLGPVLDLLIADETNPRSMMWQLQQLARHASQLPRDGYEGDEKHEKRQVDGMLSVIASTHFSALAKAEDLQAGNLLRLCDHLMGGVIQLSNTITQHYFAHALPRVK